ncbi:MAG: 23S rRNA (adenine(2503)-C(2))-methyltransferase RlmN [Cyclobacteriaceae bacterium]|nr:23S rRNA (adenine(2503)-C(2))-methyltransferase RlmN [Cyclobacteriaceae bacterium]
MMSDTTTKIDIRNLNLDKLSVFLKENGEKAFRAKQIDEWLWKKSAKSFDDMTNISLSTRELLKQHFTINHIAVDKMQRSNDGTIKNAVKLFDDMIVESVLIPTSTRITACISSQVGCSLDCNFCATARLKRMRNLNADEIYDQVAAIMQQGEEYFERPLTNIVYMGMGEPLLNYQNVISSIEKITSPKGLGMSPRRITLSTVGIPKMIKKLADDEVKFKLAVSLHSAIDETRSQIMPINEKSNVTELLESLQYWYTKTNRIVTFEYVVWKGVNDDKRHIDALVKYCKKVPSKVNLIEYNAIDDPRFVQASSDVIQLYVNQLEKNNITVNIRNSRGKDIDAACGQLANKEE